MTISAADGVELYGLKILQGEVADHACRVLHCHHVQ